MHTTRIVFRHAAVLAAAMLHTSGLSGSVPDDFDYSGTIQPFLANYCYSCHGRERARAEVDLERLKDDPLLAENHELWEKVRHVLETHEMPPENRPQPSQTERLAFVQSLGNALAHVAARIPPNPGTVTIRRLNRDEYRNTIRDLLGVDYDTHAVFPHDESGYGFDNIGDVLSLPPMLLEKYLDAAEEIARRVIVTEDPALRRVHRLTADRFTAHGDSISTIDGDVWGFYREGEIRATHEIAETGDYLLRLRAYGEQAGNELPKLGVRVDGREIHVQPVEALEGSPETYDVRTRLEKGTRRLAVAYLNNFNADGDRNVFLASFEVIGPLDAPPEEYPPQHRRILPRKPQPGHELEFARERLRQLASRAYRRPVKDPELDRLVALVRMAMEDGETFERGIQLALQAILVSPHFLYRWELDPPDLEPGTARELNDYEVASRLSYFLWCSMPDDELFELAAAGKLTDPEILERQVRRMIADPKADAFVDSFGGQWLQIRSLDQHEPDPTVFPSWSDELRRAMNREAELFLASVIREDRSILELLDADYTFLNETLARHYGVPGVEGDEFRRVKLPPDSGRGGVITMGSVLTATSVPTRTAPVIRGKWILEQILGTPPPPPPPNVPPIEEGETASKSATLRQRLELHRSQPDCIVCHQKMDPLGFALENFDGIGAWRQTDGPHPIDNTAELPDGRRFAGAQGLKSVLLENEAFPRTFASKLLTFALGRGLEGYDRPAVARIVEEAETNGFKFSAFVLAIARSDPFLKRQPTTTQEHHASLDR